MAIIKVRLKLRREIEKRYKAGFNAAAQAVGCKTCMTYWSQIVNGRMNPTEEEMQNFSSYYGVPAQELFPD